METLRALIVEKNPSIVSAVRDILVDKSYTSTAVAEKAEALGLLRTTSFPLAIVGEANDCESVFDSMREIVMTSPMTSLILISDLPPEAVDSKAEGYGILGQIDRSVRAENLNSLLEQFKKINQSIPSKHRTRP
jgi:DNA-binding NtrC family response regulator